MFWCQFMSLLTWCTLASKSVEYINHDYGASGDRLTTHLILKLFSYLRWRIFGGEKWVEFLSRYFVMRSLSVHSSALLYLGSY